MKTPIDPNEVWEVLRQLDVETHYLGQKPTEEWDKYDLSNYKALLHKAGRAPKHKN